MEKYNITVKTKNGVKTYTNVTIEEIDKILKETPYISVSGEQVKEKEKILKK
ncbi:MAG: hypothetical protein IKO78_02500 [Bacilli bacterium]|nr:hypothetical protein [Bacilli bacterium]